MMFENEDYETDGAVNEFRKQHGIRSESFKKKLAFRLK